MQAADTCEMFVTSNVCYIKYPLVGKWLNETDSMFQRQILIIISGTKTGAKERQVKIHNEKILRFWSSEELSE
jgi:hypothetical protein